MFAYGRGRRRLHRAAGITRRFAPLLTPTPFPAPVEIKKKNTS